MSDETDASAESTRSLSLLDTPLLVRIYRALHDLKGGDLQDLMIEIIWERLGVTATEGWPEHDPGIVSHCSLGTSFDDPKHRLAMVLPEMRGMKCSCGARTPSHRSYKDPMVLKLKLRQRVGRASVWPTTSVAGVPHFEVCKYASCADDPEHAPSQHLRATCICSGYLGPSVQLLPVD